MEPIFHEGGQAGVTHLRDTVAIHLIEKSGERSTPCGCPFLSHVVEGRSPDDPWTGHRIRSRPRKGVAEGGGGKVRHPGGVEVNTSTFPQVIAAIAARPVAMKRGSLTGSSIPLWCRLPFALPPADPAGDSDRGPLFVARVSRHEVPKTPG